MINMDTNPDAYGHAGRDAALRVWKVRGGTWLDPLLVSHFVLLVAESEGAREGG